MLVNGRGWKKEDAGVTVRKEGAWREAGDRMRVLVAELEELAAVAADTTKRLSERNEAASRIRTYWVVHQRYQLEADSRPCAEPELPRAGWLRVSALSKRTGIPMRTLRRWCESGDLPASKRGGGVWYVRCRGLEEKLTHAMQHTPPYFYRARPTLSSSPDD